MVRIGGRTAAAHYAAEENWMEPLFFELECCYGKEVIGRGDLLNCYIVGS